METLVVGAGAVGRWFADILEDDVAFADIDEATAEAAADAVHRQHGRTARVVPLETAESFGLVCIAVPMSAAVEAIEDHGPKAQTAVVDVTGAMTPPLQAMARVTPARERASYHPLFAPTSAPGRVAAASATAGPVTDRVDRALTAAGNDLVEVDPATHDEAMATIQGRTHAAILAFGLAAEEVPTELATPVFEQLQTLRDRVTGGDPQVYADIQAAFGGAEEIAAAADRIAAADRDAFDTLYDDASG